MRFSCVNVKHFSSGSEKCYQCPASTYCPKKSVNPINCPIASYCPPESFKPMPCPNGTYSNQLGLSTPMECLECPSGEHCEEGIQKGLCSAGYICVMGSSVSYINAKNISIDSFKQNTDKPGINFGYIFFLYLLKFTKVK